MSQSVISAKSVYKIFKLGEERVIALNGVSLEIGAGEFVAIVGTSGSGKSTLLNMLAGLDRPTKGEIVIAGKHIEKLSEDELVRFRRENVGFIFQAYDLMSQLDAIENVALPLSFKGVSRPVRTRAAIELLKKMGLEKYMKHKPTEMSGGQQQRVGIARALVVKPKIIFADEPTGNLDTKTTIEVLHILQDVVHNEGNTLVMVTHDKHLASYADRRVHILDGEIVLED
ncbi:MAG: ABC transporter ATP-binding protein [Lachnospiraceae bacterium]|nr:ABC transporter ATP-binding protein [Lachnospiraceae bacterium]